MTADDAVLLEQDKKKHRRQNKQTDRLAQLNEDKLG